MSGGEAVGHAVAPGCQLMHLDHGDSEKMPNRFVQKFEIQLCNVSHYLAMAAGMSAFVMMLVVVSDVTLVALNIGSLSIAVGLVEMLMIVAVFGALAYADVLDRHVVATMLVSRLPKRWQAAFNIFSNMISLLMCFFFTWQILVYAVDMTGIKKTCLSSDLPYYPFTWVAVVGFLLLDIRFAIRIVHGIEQLGKGGGNVGS